MQIHADLSKRAVVDTKQLPWIDSPLPGVQRRMLDRDGEEVARATSIVRYAPESYFDAHVHTGGEEFLVLEGIFSDEMGEFPKGMYVRNPVGSKHRPHSKEGTIILVKLRQFDPDDQEFVRIDTNNTLWLPGQIDGHSIMTLHEYGSEQVRLERFTAGTSLGKQLYSGGQEVFVLSGTLLDEHGSYAASTWIRSPSGTQLNPRSEKGCVIYVKTGHL